MLGIGLVQQGLVDAGDDFCRWVGSIDEKILRFGIGEVEEQFTPRRLAVTARAPCFLIIGFNAAGNVVMHDETHVAAVDSHAEGVRGHRDIVLFADEFVLPVFALLVIQSAVVLDGFDLHLAQRVTDLFDTLAGGAVNDAGFVLADDLLQPREFLVTLLGVGDIQAQIRALKSPDGDVRITQIQDPGDVIPHFRCGGGGESHDLGPAKLLQRFA